MWRKGCLRVCEHCICKCERTWRHPYACLAAIIMTVLSHPLRETAVACFGCHAIVLLGSCGQRLAPALLGESHNTSVSRHQTSLVAPWFSVPLPCSSSSTARVRAKGCLTFTTRCRPRCPELSRKSPQQLSRRSARMLASQVSWSHHKSQNISTTCRPSLTLLSHRSTREGTGMVIPRTPNMFSHCIKGLSKSTCGLSIRRMV